MLLRETAGCNLFYFNCGSALLTHKVLGTVNFRTRLHTLNSEAATRGVLYKKTFLKYSQNSKKNTCARVSF